MPRLTSYAAFKVALCTALQLPILLIAHITIADLKEQADNAPRRLPWYSTANAAGFNCPREIQHYGGPHWGGALSNIRPFLSREEFRSHFLFPSEVFAEVLAALDFPRTPGRPADKDFAYMHDENEAFHKINRPGQDGNMGELQGLFYNGAKKAHGMIFELITFPDGLIGRAFGPVAGRHHDVYVAEQSNLRGLCLSNWRTQALQAIWRQGIPRLRR